MKSNFEEKRANRQARYERLASKFNDESAARYKRFHDLLSVIPMGQPILVGHHSEKGHRSLLNKADNAMRSSVQADKKSDYYAAKAAQMEKDNVIFSDDPAALEKLQAKLATLEKNQELMKACNKIAKNKKTTLEQKIQQLVGLGLKETTATKLMEPVYGRVGVPSYSLTNNNANIRTVKQRIEKLQAQAQNGNQEFTYGNDGDVKVIENADENRVQIFFPGKPSEEVRKTLKGYGYRWSPSNGCWQAFYSERSKWTASEIVKIYIHRLVCGIDN